MGNPHLWLPPPSQGIPTISSNISRPTAPMKPQDPGLGGDKTPVSPGYSPHTLPPGTRRGTGAVPALEFLRAWRARRGSIHPLLLKEGLRLTPRAHTTSCTKDTGRESKACALTHPLELSSLPSNAEPSASRFQGAPGSGSRTAHPQASGQHSFPPLSAHRSWFSTPEAARACH